MFVQECRRPIAGFAGTANLEPRSIARCTVSNDRTDPGVSPSGIADAAFGWARPDDFPVPRRRAATDGPLRPDCFATSNEWMLSIALEMLVLPVGKTNRCGTKYRGQRNRGVRVLAAWVRLIRTLTDPGSHAPGSLTFYRWLSSIPSFPWERSHTNSLAPDLAVKPNPLAHFQNLRAVFGVSGVHWGSRRLR